MADIYRVKSGESLSVIAAAALNDMNRWPEIAHLNNIRHPYIIYPGQVLELPPENPKDAETTEVTLPTAAALATERAGFTFSPATVLLLVAGAALLFMTRR